MELEFLISHRVHMTFYRECLFSPPPFSENVICSPLLMHSVKLQIFPLSWRQLCVCYNMLFAYCARYENRLRQFQHNRLIGGVSEWIGLPAAAAGLYYTLLIIHSLPRTSATIMIPIQAWHDGSLSANSRMPRNMKWGWYWLQRTRTLCALLFRSVLKLIS